MRVRSRIGGTLEAFQARAVRHVCQRATTRIRECHLVLSSLGNEVNPTQCGCKATMHVAMHRTMLETPPSLYPSSTGNEVSYLEAAEMASRAGPWYCGMVLIASGSLPPCFDIMNVTIRVFSKEDNSNRHLTSREI